RSCPFPCQPDLVLCLSSVERPFSIAVPTPPQTPPRSAPTGVTPMAHVTQRDPNRLGVNGLPRQNVSNDTPRDDQSDQPAPVRGNDLRGDMKRAAEENAHPLGKRSRSEADVSAELVALRADNTDLRRRLDEWEQLLTGHEDNTEANWAEKQREYE